MKSSYYFKFPSPESPTINNIVINLSGWKHDLKKKVPVIQKWWQDLKWGWWMCFWRCLWVLHPPAASVRRLICEAALRSSSCHLWAAGRSGSVSQLSVPPHPQTPARVFDACSCLSHPGENHLDRNKIKSLYMTPWKPFNRAVIYWYSFFMFCLQVANWCDAACEHDYVEQMLLTHVVIWHQNESWDNMCCLEKFGLAGHFSKTLLTVWTVCASPSNLWAQNLD